MLSANSIHCWPRRLAEEIKLIDTGNVMHFHMCVLAHHLICKTNTIFGSRTIITKELSSCENYYFIHNVGKGVDHDLSSGSKTPISVEAFCLTLPGCELHLPSLLLAKKFRNRGNKDGALAAFRKLKNDGL